MVANVQTSGQVGDDVKAESSSIKLEDLFDSSRIQVKPKFFKAVLYFPVAFILLLVRLVAGVLGVVVLSLLPRTSQKRSSVVKGICKILGLVIEVDNKYSDENAKLLIANHVSIWDRLAVNCMVPSMSISRDSRVENDPLAFWKDVDIIYSRDLSNVEIFALQKYIEGSAVPALHFPEGATTNGKVGLLKFQPSLFSLNAAVQPVLIRVSMSSFMNVSPSVLGSSAWADVLWSFILPSTFFTLKTLPSMAKLPEESALDFSKRVQHSMAHAMGLTPTAYTSSDKVEFIKRSKISAASVVSNVTIRSNVSDTGRSSSSLQNSKQLSSHIHRKLSMNTAAETFGKSPKERMLSYKERRALLLETARMKYLEKHM